MISLKIDVTKIDKNRLFKGEKGTYLNAILIETPNSEYSDYMIVEDINKDDREAGVKGNILGNAKILKKQNQNEDNYSQPVNKDVDDNEDDLPF